MKTDGWRQNEGFVQVDSKWYVKTLWYVLRNENVWKELLKFYLVTECANYALSS
jgi:hypothetical protein